ncbi:MAG TPA: hypothetical protein VHY58_14355 [Streptosporangiaceae bacterium]|jgi:hypothetical protein|nr:hypothetical protein [Streptosporangiaceae bacterium]
MTTALVGGGPAGAALLLAAARTGALDALLDDGLTVIHAGPADGFGAGRLGGYLVRSDTRARVFAECAAPVLGRDPANGLIARCDHDEPVPLRTAAALLAAAGRRVLDRVRAHPRAVVLSPARVTGLRAADGGVTLRLAGRPPVQAHRAVLALGGRPWTPPGLPVEGRLVLHSEQVLRRPGYRELISRLREAPRRGRAAGPRVTVVGGSHSAFAVAGLLLRSPVRWAPGAITIAHRSPVLVTYPDAAAARADGAAVRGDQICPATGMVHRFGGLRSDAAAVYQRIRRGAEPRARLVRVPAGWDWFAGVTRDDPAVVAATGYGPAVTGLLGGDAGSWWDGNGRLRTGTGAVLPHVYGLGLGTRRPRGPGTGGEPAFDGAIDGVWFYQNIVAPDLLALVLADGSPG